MDIYRAVWEVNHNLAPGAPRFRVVNLNAFMDWSFVKTTADRESREVMKKVFPEGDSDKVMAETIIREFVEKGQKALIYSGIHHAFTRYKQPIYYQGKFVRFVEDRMGNRVCRRLGDKVFTIKLHAPWSDKNYQNELYPLLFGLFSSLTDIRREYYDCFRVYPMIHKFKGEKRIIWGLGICSSRS